MDFTELKASTLAFLEKQDDADLVDQLDSILALAESWINRRVAGYQREVTASLTADAAGRVALPAGFVKVRSIYFGTVPYRYEVSGAYLTIKGGASKTFDVTYLAKLTPLSEDNATNWLIEAAPDAYLDACLMRACIFLQDIEGAAAYGSTAGAAIDELTLQNTVAQYGSASLQFRGNVA